MRRISRRRVAVSVARAVGAIVLILGVYFVAPLEADGWGSTGVRAAVSLTLLVSAVAFQTVAVVRSDAPALRAVEALGISVSLVLVVAASAYLTLSSNDPAAFTEPLDHIGALYLAMMTLTTVGFGDIGALSDGARIAVMGQMIVNIVVLGVAAKIVLGAVRSGGRRFLDESRASMADDSA